jgi:hypothetical protein
MNITIMLEPVGKTGLVTIDGGVSEELGQEMSPFLDQFLYGMCLAGWTFLLGSRGRTPRVLDPAVVASVLGRKDAQESSKPPEGPTQQPSNQQPPEPDTSNLSQEERLNRLFRGWMPPSPDSGT